MILECYLDLHTNRADYLPFSGDTFIMAPLCIYEGFYRNSGYQGGLVCGLRPRLKVISWFLSQTAFSGIQRELSEASKIQERLQL